MAKILSAKKRECTKRLLKERKIYFEIFCNNKLQISTKTQVL